MSAARPRGNLAARAIRLTLAVGAVTILAAVVVATISTSRLTAETAQMRDLRVIQGVEDAVQEQLHTLSAAVEQAAADDTGRLSGELGRAYERASGGISSIIVCDRAGRIRYVCPKDAPVGRSVRSTPAFLKALAGGTGFVSARGSEGKGRELWLTRTAFDSKGEPLFVLTKIDTAFLQGIIDRVGVDLPRRKVLILQGQSVVVSTGGVDADMTRASWSARGAQWGAVRTVAASGDTLAGHYNDIGGLEGLDWRAVIVAPASEQLSDTLRTLAPPFMVLLGGGLVALGVAWVVVVRLSRPLRDLERTALKAASGSYVRQINTDRDDEIGRAAVAFNAVALRLNALHELAQLLAQTSSLEQVLDGILTATVHLMGRGASAIYLLDGSGERFVPVRTRGFELSETEPVPVARGQWLTKALETNDLSFIDGNASDLAEQLPGIRGAEVALVAAPLVVDRHPLGAVVVARSAGGQLSDGEQEMLRTFSAHAAVAVRTSRLFEVESSSRRTSEALRSVAEELVRPTSLQAALNTVESVVADLFSARDVIIALNDSAALGIIPSQSTDLERQVLKAARELYASSKERQAIVLGRGESATVDGLLDELDSERALFVPIALETDHGAVLMAALHEPVPDDAVDVGRALGDEIALALDNAYFYQRAVTRAANLETIFRISQAVGSSLQINVVLNRVLDVVQKILSADALALMSFDPMRRKLSTTMGRGSLPGHILHLVLEPGEDIPGEVFQHGEPVAVRDLSASISGVAKVASDGELRSMLAVPLLARGRSTGVLIVFSAAAGAFSDEDVNVLQTFASQAALAIDTAQLYSREHEVASVLKKSILPEGLPDFEEVAASAVYAPAGTEIDIGGDYYDLFRGKDGAIWFAIADVCGKGVYAATKTSMIKYAVRALAAAGRTPAGVVSEVNSMIAETGDASDIVTLWAGCYRADERTIVWADGGHPPGLLRREDGSIETLGVTGPLLGVSGDAFYEDCHITVNPGECVLLYTDGVSEARRGNIFFGEERVRELLKRPMNTHVYPSSLLAEVHDYVDGELRDDVAVLVVAPRAERSERKEKDLPI